MDAFARSCANLRNGIELRDTLERLHNPSLTELLMIAVTQAPCLPGSKRLIVKLTNLGSGPPFRGSVKVPHIPLAHRLQYVLGAKNMNVDNKSSEL